MAQVTRRTIRSPWSTGIPEYVWRHQANIAAHNVTRQLPTRRATQVLRTGTESASGQSLQIDGHRGRSAYPPTVAELACRGERRERPIGDIAGSSNTSSAAARSLSECLLWEIPRRWRLHEAISRHMQRLGSSFI